jgi:hypothetical protein
MIEFNSSPEPKYLPYTSPQKTRTSKITLNRRLKNLLNSKQIVFITPASSHSYVAFEPMESLMLHLKKDCVNCPPPHHHKHPVLDGPRDWETHPSWIAGMEALNAYGDWVSSFVLPIAFQWIEEHKAEVYASVPAELRDDVGVVIAAAFRLVKEFPAYKVGLEKSAIYEAELAGLSIQRPMVSISRLDDAIASKTRDCFWPGRELHRRLDHSLSLIIEMEKPRLRQSLRLPAAMSRHP